MLSKLVEKLLSLAPDLRPSFHSLGEDEKGQPIGDPKDFVNSLAEKSPAPYLTNDYCSYNISFAAPKPIICHGFLEVSATLVRRFMMEMADLRPIFGFACTPEERYQRNRVMVKIGVNNIESWVGRDTQKYVPGLYWLTLLPDALAVQHDVPISAVEAVALEHVELEGEQHLFRFYENPDDWGATSVVADLCASLAGVFDVEKVKAKLPIARNYLEVNSILREWR
ncbi:hypothetical protein ACFW16_11750 [Inquilinus sp. NPDC058860]|uniref:hypothetical protein n=1 Tax=Inquilinus sp. NPDC058860 TaxID=3346652 RepID=UPI00367D331E